MQLHHVTRDISLCTPEVSGDKLVSIQDFVIPQNPKPESVKRWPPPQLAPTSVAYTLGFRHRIHWIEGETNTSSETVEIRVDLPNFTLMFQYPKINKSKSAIGIRLDEMIRPGRLTLPGTDSSGCACSGACRSEWLLNHEYFRVLKEP